MPDWSYRTFLQPLLCALGRERGRRVAVATLGRLARTPFGPALIDFLGHMRADERLRVTAGGIELPGPIVLGAAVDPRGEALKAFSRFGVGLVEVGPVDERMDDVVRNLERANVPVAVRIGATDPAAIRRIVQRLEPHATMFVVETREQLEAAQGTRPVALRVSEESLPAARDAGAILIAGGVTNPADAKRLLDAGATLVAIDESLISSGPGLPKRCNEALLSAMATTAATPEPLSLDAAKRAWFWALLLGASMFAGGVLAAILAATRVVLPYDESLCGMTRAQLATLNPRLLPFMAHDRMSLAGTMLSLGIFYAALAWSGIRRGAHWAHVTVIVSAITGTLSFFSFLGFGYFDPFHAFVTAILTQFVLLCMVLPGALTPAAPPEHVDWRETAAWRRGQWGQLLFVMTGVAITGAGLVILSIGSTSVLVDTDVAFLRTTAAQLRLSYDQLVPLIAHDRASLGGMLIANGLAIWLAAQWGFRAGARWLWLALAWGGNIAFACANGVHFVVGYVSPLHLAPAVIGWIVWNVALLLSYEWLVARTRVVMPRTVIARLWP